MTIPRLLQSFRDVSIKADQARKDAETVHGAVATVRDAVEALQVIEPSIPAIERVGAEAVISKITVIDNDIKANYSNILNAKANADSALDSLNQIKNLKQVIEGVNSSEYLTHVNLKMEQMADFVQDGCFQMDVNGDLMPKTAPVANGDWATDSNGDIMPA